MIKPTDRLDWMPGDVTPTTIIEPVTEKKVLGWAPREKPSYQFFNWAFQLIDVWQKFFEKTSSQYDVTVGAGSDCTHATLAAAIADGAVGTNIRVLLRDNIAGGALAISLTKAGWKIYARPGVTLAKGSATTGISAAAANIEINGLRFTGFTVSGDKAIAFTSAGDYGRVLNCNFLLADTEVDDTAVTAGKKPILMANHSEV